MEAAVPLKLQNLFFLARGLCVISLSVDCINIYFVPMVKMILWFRNILVTLLDIGLCPPLKRIFGKVDGINIHFVLMVMLAELYPPTKRILGQS